MKTNRYLLPNPFKRIGWVLSIPSATVLLWYFFTGGAFRQDTPLAGLFNEPYLRILKPMTGSILTIFMFSLMCGLLFVAFSKEKTEDEYIAKLRGDSLIWAVIVNAVLMIALSVTVFGGWFMWVSFFNLYTTLVLFIIKFHLALHRFYKEAGHEE